MKVKAMKNKSVRIVINISLIVAIILGTFFINIPYIYGEDTPANSEETREISIGESSTEPKEANRENVPPKKDETPYIKEYAVAGEYNRDKRGIEYFANITISLIGENLTDDHFLTEEGLHWSQRTETKLITGVELGNYDFSAFPNEAPNREVKAYRIENGDSGRLTYVGKTKSGVDLDIIWTIIDSDKSDWEQNSGYLNTGTEVKGVAFTGEQFFRGGSGNSIAVLYNRASNLGINYKIVKHGTFEEMPVILSFISSDIDSAQGVETDLANIVEIIPPDSNLVKKDGVIYDSQGGVVNLNGSSDLPKGGYLGAGFLSSFNYIFYSPAPLRVNDSYYYPIATRYDIFGSSLQAKTLTRINQHISLEYLDKQGNEIKEKEYYQGYTDESYNFKSLIIPKYKLVDIIKDDSDVHHPVVKFIYSPEYEIRFKFVDENGKPLSSERKYTFLDGKEINYKPIEINGYESPSEYKGIITKDTEHVFVYKKVEATTSSHSPPPSIDNKKANATALQNVEVKHDNKKTYNKPSHIESKKAVRDPFLVNTNMSKYEKKQFLDYINEVARQAKKKYGNDKNKINHAIANAIAYPVYATDFLQSHANDFGNKPSVKNYSDIYKFLNDVHFSKNYSIDFPHLGTTLASAEDSGKVKGVLKWLAGLSIGNLWGNSPKDNFFQQNSLTGDLLSNIEYKDYKSDIDAIVFHYHPNFKNLTLDEAIIKYYNMENLDIERERLYKEVLKLQAGEGVTEKEQELLNILGAAFALGGILLISFTALKKAKEELRQLIKYLIERIYRFLRGVGAGAKLFAKDPLQFTRAKIVGPISNLLADTLSSCGKKLNELGKKLYYKAIEPIDKYIVKPVFKHVVKPLLSFSEKKILKPIVQKVIKPTCKFINKKIIQPTIKKVIKPIVKNINRKVIKPVYNKVIKPVVQPIYRKVVKPVVKYAPRNLVKKATKFVKKKIGKPIAKFFKRLWR